ncbi:Arginine/serine-rich protein PNISR [Pseudolycoriella hygida]|uniref:Arginine/serine-rich protein PNISR n=1 Tax=Pseudolycoriella hygida TaxID=35572 RepID=A0A9Q0RWQ1_9DIPT|nr:Arginine/serine-rich protein PNISR [Pseudolycoriella hygida]
MFPFKQNQLRTGLQMNSEDNTPMQWPINQAAYQNLSNDQVDWAALAQQWIYMKESYPKDNSIPSAPPPPSISSLRDFDEKGEAEMEVEKEDEPIPSLMSIQTSRGDDFPNQQDNNWQSSGWNSHSQHHWRKKPGWNTWTNPNVQQQAPPFRQPLLPDPSNASNKNTSSGPWQNFPNSNSDQSGSNEKTKPTVNIENFPTPLDAAKRKTLPAWIRQGLEKMEREKLKTAEKKQPKGSTEINQRRNDERFQKLSPRHLSKFDSESESDESDDRKQPLLGGPPISPYKAPEKKSRQDQLQELMFAVRTTLTDILLEVTNEEIRNIATESLSKIRLKARTAQTVSKSALTSLTGGLGLGIYADSDNSDSSSDENNANESCDSEAELQELVKRRKLSFEIKEREIEAELLIDEEKEKQWLDEDEDDKFDETVKNSKTVNHSDHKETGEIQQEKIKSSHGRTKEKKASRFSDAGDIVKNIYTHGSLIYDRTDNDKVSNSQNKLDVHELPCRSNSSANNKDSDTSSSSSEHKTVHHRSKRSFKPDNSSDDSDDERSYKRTKYSKRRESSSRERSYSSYKKTSKASRHSKYSHYADKGRDRSVSRDRGSRSSTYSSSKYKSRSRSQSRDRRSHHRH